MRDRKKRKQRFLNQRLVSELLTEARGTVLALARLLTLAFLRWIVKLLMPFIF